MYDAFIDKLHHQHGVAASDVYAIRPAVGAFVNLVHALASFSVWRFYTGLALMILLAQQIILR